MSRLDNEIARRVMKARKDAGLSQGEIGVKLGMTETGFGHYERGRSPWTVEMLFALAPILGKPVAHFLGLDMPHGEPATRLLDIFEELEEPRRSMLLGVAKAFLENQEEEIAAG